MIRAAVLALVFALVAPVAVAQAPKAIGGDWIRLGDVAPVTGEAAGMLIGPAPPAGQTLALDPAFLISLAKKSGVILAIPLDQPIYVVRGGGNTATPAPVANPARQANPAPQVGGAAAPMQVLVLVRDIPKGQLISSDDLDWADTRSLAQSRSALDMDAVVGREAKRALRGGQPVLSGDVKAPTVIHKGEPVKIVYAAPGVWLSVDGVAQNEASKGEAVRVLSSYSKRTIDAIAEAQGEARVLTR